MNLKIIGTISKELERKLKSIEFKYVQETKDADFVVVTSKVGSYFMNTTIGAIIEEAYTMEFTKGRPLVLNEKEFLEHSFLQKINPQI